MNKTPVILEHVFSRLISASPLEIWLQALVVVVGAAISFGIRQGVRRLVARRAQSGEKPSPAWPVGSMSYALILWGAYLLFLQANLNGEGLRLAALLIAAMAGARVVLHAVGRTTLGWLAVGAITLTAFLEAFGLADPAVSALNAQGLAIGSVNVTPWFAIKSIVVVGVLFWLAQRVGDILEVGVAREQVLTRSGKVLFAKLARVGLFVFALLLSLGFLGVDVTALALLSGAVGLGLGFGLQKVISNYVSWIILLMDKSIKPGDVIEVEFGGGQLRGEVTELAGRFTAITLRTGVETLIPNEVLISSPVSNWSHTNRNVQIRIPVGVAYSTDLEKALAICVQAALAAPRVLAAPKPTCLILGFGDSSVNLDVRFWISDAELGVRNVSSGVYLEIWKLFHENGIEIPFPQRDIHIKQPVSAPETQPKSS
jgi:small-conductance mechanosensitive channel